MISCACWATPTLAGWAALVQIEGDADLGCQASLGELAVAFQPLSRTRLTPHIDLITFPCLNGPPFVKASSWALRTLGDIQEIRLMTGPHSLRMRAVKAVERTLLFK